MSNCANVGLGNPGVNHGWLKKEHVLNAYQMGWRKLEEWTSQGFIRSVKVDPAKQGRRLYFTADIESLLMDLAAGKTPKSKLGRAGK